MMTGSEISSGRYSERGLKKWQQKQGPRKVLDETEENLA